MATPNKRTPGEGSIWVSRSRATVAIVIAVWVGAGRLCDRVIVLKSWNRTLIVTVRPARFAFRNRDATESASRTASRLSESKSWRSRAYVSS